MKGNIFNFSDKGMFFKCVVPFYIIGKLTVRKFCVEHL